MDTILITAIVSAFFALIVGVILLGIEHFMLIPWRERNKEIAQSTAGVSKATLNDVIQSSFPKEAKISSKLNDDLINLIEKVVGPADAIATPKWGKELVIEATIRFFIVLMVVALLGVWAISEYDLNQKFLKLSMPTKATITDKEPLVEPLSTNRDSADESLTPEPTPTPQISYQVTFQYSAPDSGGNAKTYSKTRYVDKGMFDLLPHVTQRRRDDAAIKWRDGTRLARSV